MKRPRYVGVLFTLVLVFLLALGAAPALAAGPQLSTTAVPGLVPAAPAATGAIAPAIAPTTVGSTPALRGQVRLLTRSEQQHAY